MRLLPQMKGAYHHLRRVDEVVMQSRSFAGPEPVGPMRFFQLASKARLIAGDARECEKAILEPTRQNNAVLQVLGRLSLGVQQLLDSAGDFIAMRKEELKECDVRIKWYVRFVHYLSIHFHNFAHVFGEGPDEGST